MRGHQRCGLEREWGIVSDEVLGEMSSYKDPKAMAPERRKSGQEDLYRTGSTIALLNQPVLSTWRTSGARSGVGTESEGVLSQSYSLH